MIDQTMRMQMLPAPLIIKNYVHNEPNCNYEIYMLELVNSSVWFRKRFPKGFHKPESESKGECDAICEEYGLDFKLFASSTVFRAKKELSPQVTKLSNGVVCFGESRKRETQQRTTRIHAAVRNMDIQRLKQIRQLNLKYRCIKKDIQDMLKKLETKKNLLLFFPYNVTFDTVHTYDEAVSSIVTGIENDFNVSFEYRKFYAPNYDTFFTCIYDDSFLLFKITNNKLVLCDNVKSQEIQTFYYLMDLYTDCYD